MMSLSKAVEELKRSGIKISHDRLRNHVAAGSILATKTPGGHWRMTPRQIDAAIEYLL